MQERRLARTRFSDDDHEFAAKDVQVDTAQHWLLFLLPCLGGRPRERGPFDAQQEVAAVVSFVRIDALDGFFGFTKTAHVDGFLGFAEVVHLDGDGDLLPRIFFFVVDLVQLQEVAHPLTGDLLLGDVHDVQADVEQEAPRHGQQRDDGGDLAVGEVRVVGEGVAVRQTGGPRREGRQRGDGDGAEVEGVGQRLQGVGESDGAGLDGAQTRDGSFEGGLPAAGLDGVHRRKDFARELDSLVRGRSCLLPESLEAAAQEELADVGED
mmetsp:Transcript_17736/g.54129  ORF Transcript_17736/g.54129 Transcript_17736/m.54129 type:complete len:266 (-) Transcript_17736:152-949(-)